MRRLLTLVLTVALTLALGAATVSPAQGITRGGTPDGEDHPYVGLMLALDADGNPLWRCSGTLISPTVYVTAGHCTEAPAAQAEIFFQSDLEPNPGDYGYPFGDEQGDYNFSSRGTVHVYDLYQPNAFFRYDLGVVVLDEPVKPAGKYALLPSIGYVDAKIGANGRKTSTVTAVGYGLQRASANGKRDLAARTRYQADLMVVNTTGAVGTGSAHGGSSMLLSGDAKHGGTCFGDSGGAILHGDTLVAVTSFGLNANCGGVGGVFRIDGADQLTWIKGFLG